MSKNKSAPPAKLSHVVICHISAFLLLAGCAIPQPNGGLEPAFALRGAQADLGYGPAALDRAVARFMAPSGGQPPSDGLFRPPASGDGAAADRPRLRADLDYSALDGQDLALAAGVTQHFTHGWQTQYMLRAGQGRVRYVIPAGQLRVPFGNVGIIIDEPTALQASARFVEAEALALRILPVSVPGQIALGAGAGLRVTQSHLRVRSGLLEIDSRDRQSQPYAVVQARYRPPHLPAQAFVEGRAYGRDIAGLRAGVDLVWP